MTPELIYCADGNKRFADIAVMYGFRYGARLPATVYHKPEFADQDWKAPNRERYMAALREHRPALATVLDLEREDQLCEVLGWAVEAAQYVSEAVIVIPKYSEVIKMLPRSIDGKQVRLGYSVPTSYGGTPVPAWEFGEWPIHLLGGAPQEQIKLSHYMNVVSADTNYHLGMATRYNQFFGCGGTFRGAKNRYFPKLNETRLGGFHEDVPYLAFTMSCINIRAAWMGCPAGLRYASEDDISGIKAISNKYKDELGFVNSTALKESIKRNELFVAVINEGVVGFVNFRHRRDGWHTIYEIAVHPAFRERRIGAALLESVPRPRQLKCTIDNPANEFYQKSGMTLTRTEPGRKRQLHVWQAA